MHRYDESYKLKVTIALERVRNKPKIHCVDKSLIIANIATVILI